MSLNLEFEMQNNLSMKTLLLLTLLLFTAVGHAMPAKIILIRHGEEPKGDEGTELSDNGWSRAKLLPTLFTGALKPDVLIALKKHKKNGSIRSNQTLQPISEVLKLEIHAKYNKEEIKELVQFLAHSPKLQDKTVLIAWQHETIAEIARELGARKVPDSWDHKAFDRYWVLTFKNGQNVTFQNLPQDLLEKDSEK